jgi:competence protein ComFC
VIEPFVLTKHTPVGHRIYRYFAQRYVAPFLIRYAEASGAPFTLIGVDEHVRHGYAHTALLSHAARHRNIRIAHGRLLARNRVHYAGKTLRYRLEHPRDFRYRGSGNIDAVLIDDIVTTGITLQEAQAQLQQVGINILFALTLADARK